MRDSAGARTRARDGTGALWGAGLAYRFANGVGLRGDWEFFQDLADEDYDLLSLALTCHLR